MENDFENGTPPGKWRVYTDAVVYASPSLVPRECCGCVPERVTDSTGGVWDVCLECFEAVEVNF